MENKSRDDTSNFQHHTIIQFSTLGRKPYEVPKNRFYGHTTKVAGVVSRAQIFMTRSFMGLMIILLTLFFPIGAYAEESTTQPNAAVQPTETAPQSVATASSDNSSAPAKSPKEPPSAPKAPVAPKAPKPPSPKPPKPANPKTGPQKPAPEPASPVTGPQKPNGAEADQFVKNPETGKWENGDYVWDPVTGQSQPKNSNGYSYNPETKMWDTDKWRYDPDEGKYVPNTPRIVIGAGTAGDNVRLPNDNGNNDFFSLYNDASISNRVISIAQSGNAGVVGNTLAGDALSGDALTIANIFNMINSSIGLNNGNQIATFNSSIYGNVVGDLFIDPSALASVEMSPNGNSDNSNIKMNVDSSQSINNEVSLSSQSGDAKVSGNTTGGNAASGSANAVANIINILNSSIGNGSLFLGMLNIYGNLDGDILLPPGLLNMLIASNGQSNGQVAGVQKSNINVNLNDTQSIANNINASATSGNANVSNNTSAGNATTGNATTNVNILNLTGRNVIAENSLLVFVNVLGQWVGLIVDAPAGSTSAMLGTGVSENTHRTADIDVNNNNQITNNVDVNAKSGDASVTSNTKAGDAASGDATASVNVANISNSNFSLSSWFGILFINVFGSWNGSFGIDTVAGSKNNNDKNSPIATTGENAPKVFQFIPDGSNANQGATLATVDINDPAIARKVTQAVLAAEENITGTSNSKKINKHPIVAAPTDSNHNPGALTGSKVDYTMPLIGFAIGGTLLAGEWIVGRRQRRQIVA